ncbi:hypothetical protein [Sedimentitalea sp.]|uniref:hypothetical protein n=1 Tax=Sedimentitalea sp. TaxID=2048915 RepID=UPI003299DD41
MLEVDSKVSIGNILTTFSILFALVTFLYNEDQKRQQTDRAYAADIRETIGRGLNEAARLDSELKLFFLTAETLYVATSALAVGDQASREIDVVKARDLLWSGLTTARADMERRIIEAMALPRGLALSSAEAQSKFQAFTSFHEDLRHSAFQKLAQATELALVESAFIATSTADVGNALRNSHNTVQETFSDASRQAQLEIDGFLSHELTLWSD